MRKLTVGQMADLKQISKQTLRYYDKIGLFSPQYVGNKNKYRYYDVSQCTVLDLILYLKHMGFNLTQIHRQLDMEDTDLALETVRKQIELIQDRIIELTDMKILIETCIGNYNRYIQYVNLPKELRIIKERFPRRKIFYYEPVIPGETTEAFQYNLKNLKRLADSRKISIISFNKTGLLFPEESIINNKFIATKIILFINDEFESGDNMETVPEGEFLCAYYENYVEEKENRRLLLKYIKENSLRIVGDYILEVVADLPVIIRGERRVLFRSQIPVK